MKTQKYRRCAWLTLLFFPLFIFSGKTQPANLFLLQPDRVFDGDNIHEGWAVLVDSEKISAAGPKNSIQLPGDRNTEIIPLPGCTLLPGLIEGHSHLLLHPYDETSWNDQVLVESEAERVARATVHARNTLLPLCMISARRALATPVLASNEPSKKASFPAPGCWSQARPSWLPAATARRVSPHTWRCRPAPKKPAGWTI